MDFTEKYGGTGHFDYALKIKIREAIFNTTDKEINAYTVNDRECKIKCVSYR